jgi:hypothetical protein
VEHACSKIDMQRIVSNHTYTWLRVRTKCEMDREIPSLGLPGHRDFTNSYTNPERWGLQGMDRAVITCRLPLNRGVSSYPKVPVYPSTTPVYKETTHVPLGLWPYGSTSIGHGHTRRHDGQLNLALILIIYIVWKVKHKVEHVMIIIHKLYSSS